MDVTGHWTVGEREFTVENCSEHDEGGDKGGYQTTSETVKLVGDPTSGGLTLDHSWSCSHDEDDELGFGDALWKPLLDSKESVVAALERAVQEHLEKAELLKKTLALAKSAVAFKTDYKEEEDEEDEENEEEDEE